MDFIKTYDIGVDKPSISEKVNSNWQDIVDSLAAIAEVPSALIMHVLPDKIEVARTSYTQPLENPYSVEASERLGCGLYCETVMKEKAELHVQNALKERAWKDNPDVAIDMIGYYGQPLLWPDNTVYGTICILDKKDLIPSTKVKELLGLFRKSIENDLEIIELSYLQEKLLQAEIQRQTKQINEQNIKLKDLNKNLEQRVKEEVKKNEYQQHKIFQQSRLAKLGEMISMIAHQWRQPLATISTVTMAMQVDLSLSFNNSIEEKTVDEFNHNLEKIDHLVQELSHTIDDFRAFYKPNQKPEITTTQEVCKKALNIIKSSLETHDINIVQEYSSNEEIKLYDSEMMQVILNILKNAQENFEEKQIKNRKIVIKTQNRTISICDNGEGISEDIIDRVFEPYFSTKNEQNGVGLGLYMSKTMIENHHNGKFSIENRDDGVCFIIELGEVSEE